MVAIRPVLEHEYDLAYRFIEEARAYQREQGFLQWTDKSPTLFDICKDIIEHRAYFIIEDNRPFGYVCIRLDGDPIYDEITEWTHTPYVAVHRVAISTEARGKGASRHLFRLVRELCLAHGIHAIRIDTHEDNALMRHVLDREGFVLRGKVHYAVGERLAYECIF